MKQEWLEQFQACFGGEGEIATYFAPGRVNLIGEHTDYNGGHVFPCALTIGTYACVRKRQDRTIRFFSKNFEDIGILTATLDDLQYRPEHVWSNYPQGVLWALMQKGYEIPYGCDLFYVGTIPNQSGLSSSASIEVLTAYIMKDLFDLPISMEEIASLCQFSENNFNGVHCGIMDQFAIAMGKKDHAIFLDTNTLSYTYVPVQLNNVRLVIACSNKKRGLGDSKYNERRAECERALQELQTQLSISSLGELASEQFLEYQFLIADEVRRRRAKHAVLENERTKKAVEVLQRGDLKAFGALMNASHQSLQRDYEVTGIELDTLVEAAWAQEGVLGARMTGAGFGGCTISLVEEKQVANFCENVGKYYLDRIGYAADFYTVEIGEGPTRLQ